MPASTRSRYPVGPKRAHLAAGASSPSQFGPFPHPQGLSCRRSSCRLRACKRLQQMWGGGRGGVPRGSSSQQRAQCCSIPNPHRPPSSNTHAHTHPPASQATDSQTNPLPALCGACSITLPASFLAPPITMGGATCPSPNPLRPPGSPHFHMMEQPPCTRVAKVAAKKLVVNLMLGSAVGEGAPPQPQACTLGHHAGAGGPTGPPHAPVHNSFLFLDFFFFFWRGRK
jgi:hypothetical protein